MQSLEIYEKSCLVIPGGVNSPVRSFKSVGMSPMIAESGSGDIVRDVSGREYIDFCCSWGALILGHAHPKVVKEVCSQVMKGSSFGIATEVELQIASKIVKLIPSIEKIRFVSSGTEATMTALRIARGYTGRSKIVKFMGQYHGHHDSLLVQAGSGVAFINSTATSKGVNPGVIADTICLPFNDLEAVRSFLRSANGALIAAVIVEPISGNMGVVPPIADFLQMLREETKRCGALLIFDEVMTGFRVALGGAQGLYGIDPDLTCFAKIIGGGFPVAAVGGKNKIMDCLAPVGEVYQAGTLSGNPPSLRAGLETLKIIEQPGFYEVLQEKTNRLVNPIQEAIQRKNFPGCLQQVGSMFTLFFGPKVVLNSFDLVALDNELFARFFRYLFEKGIYIPPAAQEAWFISSAHTNEHLDYTAKWVCNFINEC
jgi:glutamate-1-semialdehyde 2,1-aminomutase